MSAQGSQELNLNIFHLILLSFAVKHLLPFLNCNFNPIGRLLLLLASTLSLLAPVNMTQMDKEVIMEFIWESVSHTFYYFLISLKSLGTI